jgi:hypothetical protein
MKLAFFLVGFCLIFFRLYYKSIWPAAFNHRNRVTITIKTDGDYERIRYEGSIRLTDDETGIVSLSPEGYIQYRHNDKKMSAERDDQGHIVYDIRYDGHELSPDGDGNAIIKEALREMIVHGFDANDRMHRLYERGGDSALQAELGQLKGWGLVDMYRAFIASHQDTKGDTLHQDTKKDSLHPNAKEDSLRRDTKGDSLLLPHKGH